MPAVPGNGSPASRAELNAERSRIDRLTDSIDNLSEKHDQLAGELHSFVDGLMGTKQFPGGAFGKLETALHGLGDDFKDMPQRIDAVLAARSRTIHSRWINTTFRQALVLLTAVTGSVIATFVVTHLAGH